MNSTRQPPGGHYTALAIQPVEFCMRNNLDYCASVIVVFLSRPRQPGNLDALEDLVAALQYLELREALATEGHRVLDWAITPLEYVRMNQLQDYEASVLIDLGVWLENEDHEALARVRGMLAGIIQDEFSTVGSSSI